MKVKKKQLILGGVLVAVLVVVGIYAYLQTPPPNTLVLKEDGWYPRALTVEPGTAVTFLNKTDNAFWPASNAHPQHDLYAAFDAGRPIAPGESWTFVFDQPGKWGLHDHLRSFYTGYIYVGAEAETYDCTKDLVGADISKKRACWDDRLLSELQLNGAKAAFDLFTEFYKSDSDFTVVGCHVVAHKLGDAAYGEYLRKGKNFSSFEFPPETSYCGYGYYHGILEHLIRDNPSFEVADKFCKDLIAEREDEIPRIRMNCYHAIGHGFVPEPTDIEQWGDPVNMTAPALVACAQIPMQDTRQECFQGSFNVLGDWMWNSQFGLRFPADDSLATCRLFSDPEVAQACYYELSMRLIPFVKDDLVAIYTRYIASIEDDTIAGMIINSAAASVIGAHISEDNFISYLKECRLLPERVQDNCLHGLSGGFVAHGEPTQEYVKAIAFCADPELTDREQGVCYQNIVRTFKGAYTAEKVAEVCTHIEPRFQHFCSYE